MILESNQKWRNSSLALLEKKCSIRENLKFIPNYRMSFRMNLKSNIHYTIRDQEKILCIVELLSILLSFISLMLVRVQ